MPATPRMQFLPNKRRPVVIIPKRLNKRLRASTLPSPLSPMQTASPMTLAESSTSRHPSASPEPSSDGAYISSSPSDQVLSLGSPASSDSDDAHSLGSVHDSIADEVLSLGSSFRPDTDEEPEGDPNLDDIDKPRFPPFKFLSQLPGDERTVIMRSLRPQVKDVDSWNIAMSPEYFARNFATIHMFVILKAHYDRVRDNELFAEWLSLGDVGFRVLVEWKFKKPFFAELKKYRTIQESSVKYSATYGNALIPMPLFLHCLVKAGCDTFRLQTYGQKLPLMTPFILSEPAQANHPLASINEWDIGVTTHARDIFLFAPADTKPSGMEIYPMITPRSLGFGSIKIELRYQGENYTIKIYPRLTHVLKSFHSKLNARDPRSVKTLKDRRSTIGKMIDRLADLHPKEFGGFRIEISLVAKTLGEAKQKALRLPFFKLENWLHPTDQRMVPFKLQAMVVTKKDLLDNAIQMLSIANARDIWAGSNSGKVSNFRKQVVTDLFASFGWNAGRRNPTRCGNKDAWWKDEDDCGRQTAWEILLERLNTRFNTNGALKTVFRKIEGLIANGKVPCQKDSKGVYRAFSDSTRFRLSSLYSGRPACRYLQPPAPGRLKASRNG
ncbi:hypothetical protein C347_06199 [Cryptococcus neoformans AD2-60a]|nr:hypothetical protein C347_06199 [Cryptococcus neoformans var. grubii AD2-60a]